MIFVITLRIGMGFDESCVVYNKAYKTPEAAEIGGKQAMREYNDADYCDYCYGFSVHAVLVEE